MPRTFAERLSPEWPAFIVLRRIILTALSIHVVLATLSGYRAWVQVRSVDVAVSSGPLRPGSTISLGVVTSGRVPSDLHVEIVQGSASRTIATGRVPENKNCFYDPRSHRGGLSVVVDRAMLSGLANGRVVVRATAEGRSQFLRIPPPVVREVAVPLKVT